MPQRIVPAFLTTLVLIVACLAYDSFTVPMLSGPPAAALEVAKPAQREEPHAEREFGGLAAKLFPEGSWERQCQLILRNEQIMLFVGAHEQLDDHRLEVHPCTIVVRPNGLLHPAGPDNRTWILRSPDKAILQMQDNADTRQGSLGRIVSVYVPGEVRLNCDASTPDANDQVELATSHLQFNAQQIWTPHSVRFRWGPNLGSGTDLTIRFSDLRDSRSAKNIGQAMPGGIRSVELVQLKQLHLEPAVSPGSGAPAVPIEVTCTGSVKLDTLGGQARIHDNVLIQRFLPQGQVDALACDELVARFRMTADRESGGPFLVERLQAKGNPVDVSSSTVHSPADGSPTLTTLWHQFVSSKFEYDIQSGTFTSEAGQFKTRLASAFAKSLNPNGNASSSDPSGGDEERPTESLTIQWRKSLLWQPNGNGARLQLDGPTRCAMGAYNIVADRIRLWVEPTPAPPPDSFRLPAVSPAASTKRTSNGLAKSGPPAALAATPMQPTRIVADGQIHIETPQLDAATQTMDVNIVHAVSGGSRLSPSAQSASNDAQTGNATDQIQLSPPRNLGEGGQVNQNISAPTTRMQVAGEKMQLEVVRDDSGVHLRDVAIDGHVRCAAMTPEATDERPIVEIEGDALKLRELASESGIASIVGNPARVRGKGMDLSGPSIHLDRVANRVWISGAGSASLPLPEPMTKRFPKEAAFANVLWQAGMEFDGRVLKCDENVHIRGPSQMIRCRQLALELNRTIDLTKMNPSHSDIGLKLVQASGGVTLENRALSERGLESIDSAAVESIVIEPDTGNMRGEGPGWVETVRMGKPIANQGQPGANSLNYLRVNFQRQLTANYANRQAEFSDRIRAVYGPVRDWRDRIAAKDPRELAENQLMMNCDQLSLFQIPNRIPGRPQAELIALGNVNVESPLFSATAGRMSFDGKGLFVMESSGRAPAQLWRATQPGTPRQQLSADSIRYSPLTGAVTVDGMRSLDLGSLGNP